MTEVANRCDFAKGDRIDGKWKVESFLGEGTFGQVFRVVDATGDTYALKLLKLWEVPSTERPHLIKRFDREFDTGRIQSDYLVHTIQKGEVQGNSYIVMEYCSGGDLLSALRNTELDLPLLASHILLGLRDLHDQGKVHRDLKPENVLLRSHRQAALTDFGIAGDQNNRLTRRGWTGVPKQRFGTIAYMPPEQLNPKKGNATVLPTTDIFSFGVMMYQLLTGRLPFGPLESEADMQSYVYNIGQGKWDRKPLALTDKGRAWMPLIEGCLMADFKKRLQTINDVLPLLPLTNKNHSTIPNHTSSVNFNTEKANGLQLRIMQGEEHGRVYRLSELFTDGRKIAFVGRQDPSIWNHVGITENESSFISRRHATIEMDERSGEYVIRDGQFRTNCPIGLKSKFILPCQRCTASCMPNNRYYSKWEESLNGTYVNSVEVLPNGITIVPGDIISIGDVKLRVEGV